LNFKRFFSSQNQYSRFLILGGIAYLVWVIIYEFFIIPKTLVDEKVISSILFFSEKILNLFNHVTYVSTDDINIQMIGIDGAHPVWIGRPCNGISVMAIFSIFIAAFPGKFINKFWFIPIGVAFIHFINILRVCALAAIAFYFPDYLNFNHNYTFTLLVYSVVFLMWILWVKKFTNKI